MKPKEKNNQDLCQEKSSFHDPEDSLLDLSKMTPEEMKEYLDYLLRTRSFGC